ncbi:DcrB-related protein [Pseudomonas syringae pv. theae]|uniref:DcrB-related protein n=1 Tax=Pseudomonas syringae TaxID=317 RepID=UPI0023C64C32|nr:DcrB-related protein [Pseudomonas syringae]GKS08678.1 DcrB-related protein [Pseudomonas syringae pv. theae]
MYRRPGERGSLFDRISEARIREEKRLEEERLIQEALDAIPVPERFQTNELSFIRPEGFKDKTFHVFTLTDLGPSPLSVVIGRTPVEGDVDLETMSQMLLEDLKKALSHLEWVEALCPAEVAGVEARRVEFKWRQQGLPVHQLQLIFLHQDEQQHLLLMQVTATSNHPGGMTPEERRAFYSVVDTLELRHTPITNEAVEPT